ncbi:MAG: DUF2334 domain-containing protein [Candidatus Methylacidiphilales bacterium]|nr:DUF2334 domain-containing protein [Candidatus Methylacidiphilales bacterium]
MKLRLPLPRLLSICLLAVCTSPLFAQTTPEKPAASTAPLPDPLIPVVLKVDDLASRGSVPQRWKRITDFAIERKIKLSIGLIANSLEGDKPAYFAYIKELQNSGLIELWYHGYDHGVHKEGDKDYAEFANRPYEEMKRRFEISQKLAVEKLGAPFVTFGPPGGGNAPMSDTDKDNLTRVVGEDPAIKIWLYPEPQNERGKKLEAEGKVAILDRVWQANIEQPLFVPNTEKLVAAYPRYAKGRSYYILQGHPNQWDDARWAEFVKMVDYLQANKIPIVFASDLVPSVKKP